MNSCNFFDGKKCSITHFDAFCGGYCEACTAEKEFGALKQKEMEKMQLLEKLNAANNRIVALMAALGDEEALVVARIKGLEIPEHKVYAKCARAEYECYSCPITLDICNKCIEVHEKENEPEWKRGLRNE